MRRGLLRSIKNALNRKSGLYIFRINLPHHSLLLKQNDKSKLTPLNIFDIENELQNRLGTLGKSDKTSKLGDETAQVLMYMFDNHNALTKVFRMAKDNLEE